MTKEELKEEFGMAYKMAASIDCLNLSTAAYNALKRGIVGSSCSPMTIYEIYSYQWRHNDRGGIRMLRHIGPKTYNEINAALVDFGLISIETFEEIINGGQA